VKDIYGEPLLIYAIREGKNQSIQELLKPNSNIEIELADNNG